MKMHTIVLTGGGSAGHVTPNLAIIEALSALSWRTYYIGSPSGAEKTLLAKTNVPYYSVWSGKWRRYFSWKNFVDPFKLLIGIIQAYVRLHQLKPDVVFSKGGYVALPVVIAAWLRRVPVIAHESDMSPGLANRLSFPFVDKICVSFEATIRHFKRQDKVVLTGTPIRSMLFHGDANQGLSLCGFTSDKPCLLVMGGGQGSAVINQCLRDALDTLCEQFQVIHLCGQGHVNDALRGRSDYYQFEYVHNELPHLLAASQLIVSRSGANSLSEILALAKPHVLIPLSLKASRGDQIQNARYYQQQGISIVLDEHVLTSPALINAVSECFERRDEIMRRIKALNVQSATKNVVDEIQKIVEPSTILINEVQ